MITLLMDNKAFSAALFKWSMRHWREMPWRGCGDPYAIWLSEIILQQTRVSQGTRYWYRFMHAFPTVDRLAAASEDQVLKLWQGLGYYSRARNLHAAAQQIVQRGSFPDTYEEIRQLKGVGDYTAAAIASMAFNLPCAAVDGNVYRILARVFGIYTPINSTQGKQEFQQLADHLCPTDEAGHWNQAMMDFGSLQCTPKNPHCADCPFSEMCEALRTGDIASLPVKDAKIKNRDRYFTYYYITRGEDVLFHRRETNDIWRSLWEPVLIEEAAGPNVDPALLTKHVLTHQTIYARMIHIDATRIPTREPLPYGLPPIDRLLDQYHWASAEERAGYAIPRLVEKLLTAMPGESRDHQRKRTKH